MKIAVDDARQLTEADIVLRTLPAAYAFFDMWEAVYSGSQFDRIEEIWLDHDLGGDDTIRPLVQRFAGCSNGLYDTVKFRILTGSREGLDYMMVALRRYGKNVVYCPGWT